MGHEGWPQGRWNEFYLSAHGTLTQVLDDTSVAEALGREIDAKNSSDSGSAVKGMRTALLWSSVFWVALFVLIRLA